MKSNPEQLRDRTKAFALRILKLSDSLPNRPSAWAIAKQISRSGTSVAASYRAMCRARSKDEFYAKLCIVVEEADETVFWLELLQESGLLPEKRLLSLMDEAHQLTAIFVTSRKTASGRRGS